MARTITCPNCGAETDASEDRCPECSVPLKILCPDCGAEAGADEEQCPACGTSLAHATGEGGL